MAGTNEHTLATSSYHPILYTIAKCLHRHLFPARTFKDMKCYGKWYETYVNVCLESMSTAPSSMLILPISLYLSPLKEMFFLASFLFHSFPATISLPPLSDVFLSQPSISLLTTDNVFLSQPSISFPPSCISLATMGNVFHCRLSISFPHSSISLHPLGDSPSPLFLYLPWAMFFPPSPLFLCSPGTMFFLCGFLFLSFVATIYFLTMCSVSLLCWRCFCFSAISFLPNHYFCAYPNVTLGKSIYFWIIYQSRYYWRYYWYCWSIKWSMRSMQ